MSTIPQKRCSKCGETKPLDQFHKQAKNKDGVRTDCKACRLIVPVRYRDAPPGTRRCSQCLEYKCLALFPPDKKRSDGVYSWCYDCTNRKNREYHERNPIVSRQRGLRWYYQHRERLKKNGLLWQNKNPAKARMLRRRWEQNNPELASLSKKKWADAHPDSVRANTHRRRARIKGNGGSFTGAEWQALCRQYDYRCLCCGEQKPLTVDHIIPTIKGGRNSIDNIQPLCQSCNAHKSARTIDYRPQSDVAWYQQESLL